MIHNFLATKMGEFQNKVETLNDLHDFVCAFYRDGGVGGKIDQEISAKIKTILALIYSKNQVNFQSNVAKTEREQAADLIEATYKQIMQEARIANLLVPNKEFIDELADIESSY